MTHAPPVLRILVVDDHPVVRHGLRALLTATSDMVVLAEASHGAQALQLAMQHQPDVALVDLVLPDMDGPALIAQLRQACPDLKVLVLTNYHDEARILAAVQAGACSFFLKDVRPPALLSAIRATARGEPSFHASVTTTLVQARTSGSHVLLQQLTERERMVLACLGRGLSNAAIAQELHMSEGTVRTHISHLLPKIQVQDRTQAALFAVRAGLGEHPL